MFLSCWDDVHHNCQSAYDLGGDSFFANLLISCCTEGPSPNQILYKHTVVSCFDPQVHSFCTHYLLRAAGDAVGVSFFGFLVFRKTSFGFCFFGWWAIGWNIFCFLKNDILSFSLVCWFLEKQKSTIAALFFILVGYCLWYFLFWAFRILASKIWTFFSFSLLLFLFVCLFVFCFTFWPVSILSLRGPLPVKKNFSLKCWFHLQCFFLISTSLFKNTLHDRSLFKGTIPSMFCNGVLERKLFWT